MKTGKPSEKVSLLLPSLMKLMTLIEERLPGMQRRIKISLIGACLILGMLYGCATTANQPVQIYPAAATLFREQTVDIQLPAGDYVGQVGTDALFMSTVWINGSLPTELVTFSMLEARELWRADLHAPPLQVLNMGNVYLVGTAKQDGNGRLTSVSVSDGKVIWDKVFGNSMVAVAQHDTRVFVATAQGVLQIDPATGDTLMQAIIWDKKPSSSDWRALAIYDYADETYLVVSAGMDIYAYQEMATGWKLLWQFHSSKTILELHVFSWQAGGAPHLLALAHSVVYDIRGDVGETVWRLDNNDINQDAQPVRCYGGETYYAFRNVMSGVYLVNHDGLVRTLELPGGAAMLGPIPLPISANPAFGLTTADITGDGQDEIIVRSVTHLFVFDCQLKLLADTELYQGSGETLVSQLRDSPRYRPLILNDQIVIAEKGQISYFSFKP